MAPLAPTGDTSHPTQTGVLVAAQSAARDLYSESYLYDRIAARDTGHSGSGVAPGATPRTTNGAVISAPALPRDDRAVTVQHHASNSICSLPRSAQVAGQGRRQFA